MSENFSYSEIAECRLTPDLQLVGKTLSLMKQYFEARGLDRRTWSELELATAEALNNAVEHGCADRSEAEVVCRWKWSDETIQIEITDASNYQPPNYKAKLPDDPLSEGGRGAFLIEQLVDTVEHVILASGHSIRLKKRVGLEQKG
jgi:anti-sigma regulatory factor (Ser/Thr protein kinase)